MKRAFLVFVTAALLSSTASAGRLVFKEEVVVGEIPKPAVAVFLTRQNLNDRYRLDLRESFLPKIVDAVHGGPF